MILLDDWQSKALEYLFEAFWDGEVNGGGELGESVYGEKADERPPVGDGTRGLFRAIATWLVGVVGGQRGGEL